MNSRVVRSLMMGVSALLILWACEDRDPAFEGAPSASAPTEVKSPQPASSGLPPAQGEMPSDHPPVGQTSSASGMMPAAAPGAPTGGVVDGTSGPLQWTTPEGWTPVKPSSGMRYAEYLIEGSSTPLSLTMFYFGPNGGGSIQQNLDRWKGQFDTSQGSAPVTEEIEVRGMKVYTLDVAGTYDAGAAMGSAGPQKNQRMLGAIATAPTGNYFVKLVGPTSAVNEQREAFDAFVSSLKAGQ